MGLLPLPKDPFVPPADRDMLPSERRCFVNTHRTCVLGYARRDDGPAMSVVYYIPTDDGDLLVATMGERAKAKAATRLGWRPGRQCGTGTVAGAMNLVPSIARLVVSLLAVGNSHRRLGKAAQPALTQALTAVGR